MNTIKNRNKLNGLVVISAKEHGKLYSLKEGKLTYLDEVEEHPATYSDNEGFFVRSGNGIRYGSGSPHEELTEQNLLRYFKAISVELSETVKELQPEKIYIFEPEYLKGKLVEKLENPNHIPVVVVAYGNFVDSTIEEVLSHLDKLGHNELDPADPASVAGEENAEEKRKILEVGKLRDTTGE
ncbi:hypothetical protein H6784_01465 [Candidatus Nomurabacteria bacterium]|nr:hypothetical protein [Candidatus Kaiserbacteria bacterium]MCB9814062.1 hypothetical protein [Candidatus Nomurabacteria bacterium]